MRVCAKCNAVSRFYTGTPIFKFGTGLSYTSFEHRLSTPPRIRHQSALGDDLHLSPLSKRVAAEVVVRTRNSGARVGAEVGAQRCLPACLPGLPRGMLSVHR